MNQSSPALALIANLSGLLLLLVSITVSAATLAELQQADRLRIKTWIEPAEGIVARQQLKLQIEVATDKWFSGGTRIGHFEVEDAVVLQRENFALNSTRTEGDKSWTVQQWTLVVYPQRSGLFKIPAIPLNLSLTGDDLEPIKGQVQSQPLQFTAAQPGAMQGIETWVATSRFEVSETYDKSLEDLRPGDALRRTVSISADNLPAMMLPRLRTSDITGIAIYTKPAQLADKINRGEYRAERTQQLTYVFENPGEYQLPAETFYWWNLENGSLETITLAAQDLQVSGVPGQSGDAEATAVGFSERLDALLPMLYRVVVVIIILLAMLWLFRKRKAVATRNEDIARGQPPAESRLLKQARKACRRNDDEKALGYLYQWMSHYGHNGDGVIGTQVNELGNTALSQAYKEVMQAIYARDKSDSDTCRFVDRFVAAVRSEHKPRNAIQWKVELKLN